MRTREPNPTLRTSLLPGLELSLTAWRLEIERKLQLVLLIAVKHIAYRIANEPGERDTVFFGQFCQLNIILLIDRDRYPICQLILPPGSYSRARPPKRCITVVNRAAN